MDKHFEHSKTIDDYPDYRICPCGVVLSLKSGTPREVKPFPRSRYGHFAVNLCRDSKMRTLYVSRLVAIAFLPEPAPGQTKVLHGDDNPANNAATNLRWGTSADNSGDMVSRGRQSRGTSRALAKLTDEDVRQIRELAKSTKQNVLARRFGISTSTMNSIVKGDTWRHVS